MIWHLTVVIFLGRQFDTAPFLEKTILQCSEDNLPVVIFLRRQLSTALFLEKTIVHCTEDNCPLLRRQFYSAKKTMWQWSFLEKTILPKKTILPLFKNWSPKLIAFCKKSIDFWHLTFKVQFRHFLTNHNSLQDCLKTISFEHVVPWAKLLHFRAHHLWNSTTELTLKHISINICISGDFWGQIFKSCPKPEWAYSKRKHTKRLLAKKYYSPQSNVTYIFEVGAECL